MNVPGSLSNELTCSGISAAAEPRAFQGGAHRLAPHDLPDWRECAKVPRRTTLPRFDFNQPGWICDPAR
jgi:hypothetical protein